MGEQLHPQQRRRQHQGPGPEKHHRENKRNRIACVKVASPTEQLPASVSILTQESHSIVSKDAD